MRRLKILKKLLCYTLSILICSVLIGCNRNINDYNVSSTRIFIDNAKLPLYFEDNIYVEKDSEYINLLVPYKKMICMITDKYEKKVQKTFDKNVIKINGEDYIILDKLLNEIDIKGQYNKEEDTFIINLNENTSEVKIQNVFTPFADSDQYLDSDDRYKLDSKGVLMFDYGDTYDVAGKQYNPSWISAYAFTLYRDFLVNENDRDISQEYYDKFFKQVDWLIDNKVKYNDFYVWEYNFDNDVFGAISPWRSAMANGRVLSALTKAYILSNDKKYLEASEMTYGAFLYPTDEFGVATFPNDETAYYEEVADENIESSKVLNGHIYALSGLYDYWQATGRVDVKEAFDKGVRSLTNDLDEYDAGFISYYSLKPSNPKMFAEKNGYNNIHVWQLLWLYEVTGEPIFLEYALKFYSYEKTDYDIDSKGSTNEITHGPDKMNLTFGSNYWSHNSFPTWIILDMKKAQEISDIYVLGHTLETSPMDFTISVSEDEEKWEEVIHVEDNKDERYKYNFKEYKKTRYIKLEINKDNGSGNVAINSVGITKKNTTPFLCDFKQYSSSNLPERILANDVSKFFVRDSGWFLINNEEYNSINSIRVDVDGEEGSNLILEGTDDLDSWIEIQKSKISKGELQIKLKPDEEFKYYRIKFNDKIKSLNNLTIE